MKMPEIARALGDITNVFDEMLSSLSTLQCLSDLEVHKTDEKTLLNDALVALLENYAIERCAVFLCSGQDFVKSAEIDWHLWQNQNKQHGNKQSVAQNQNNQVLVNIENHFVQITAESGKPLSSPNFRNDDQLHSGLNTNDMLPVGSILTAPIRSGGQTLGVVVMSHSEENSFNEWHQRLLILYSNFLGQILTTNRLMKNLEEEVRGRTHQLEEVLEETRHLKEHYETLAMVDELTGLYNRRFFFAESKLALSRALRFSHSFSLILMDIDRFKQVNDEFGHATGDIVLQDAAKALLEILRETDVLARVGGEEFAVVLPDTPEDGAKILAERLRVAANSLTWMRDEQTFRITLSLGVTTLHPPEHPLPASYSQLDPRVFYDQLYMVADDAMYSAKDAGGNRFEFKKPDFLQQ
ncbi:MAG TPA: sensor domain-containing diguanylate cyclase [Desulfuromonadales bacterium]|nr:sensor domain-containing diguanylate cyclase [Desulfuromonadales bacterium]